MQISNYIYTVLGIINNMKKALIILSGLCLLMLGAVSCNKPVETEAPVPEFEGVIETTQTVNLGLSVSWAGYNVGSDAPEKVGSYFSCGAADPVADNLVAKDFVYDGTADPVTANWGGTWRMPTAAEVAELATLEVIRAKYKGVKGYVVSNGTVNIFFPDSGYKTGGKVNPNNGACQFWYAGTTEGGGDLVHFFAKDADTWDVAVSTTKFPYLGLPLRGVCD